MTVWVKGNIKKIKYWNNNLFTLIINAPINKFIAGQFTKIKILHNNKIIQRAYSYVNSPKNKNLEFYLVKIPNGILSKKLYNLIPNDTISITKNSFGFFTLKEIPPCKHLWMLATGTALGPYLSILNQKIQLNQFKKIILIHAVKFKKDLNYLNNMINLKKFYKNKLILKTIISRENLQNSLTGRIPNLIENGKLELSVNIKLNKNNSHVMICGNPQMVNDTQKILFNKFNMTKNSKKNPGNITTEKYW